MPEPVPVVDLSTPEWETRISSSNSKFGVDTTDLFPQKFVEKLVDDNT
jgi:hypothetical protein